MLICTNKYKMYGLRKFLILMIGGERCCWKSENYHSSSKFEGGWICFSLCKGPWSGESICNSQGKHYAENWWPVSEGNIYFFKFLYLKNCAVSVLNCLTWSSIYLQCCREVAEKYPEITYEEVVIDNCCMMVYLNPFLWIFCVFGLFFSGKENERRENGGRRGIISFSSIVLVGVETRKVLLWFRLP